VPNGKKSTALFIAFITAKISAVLGRAPFYRVHNKLAEDGRFSLNCNSGNFQLLLSAGHQSKNKYLNEQSIS